MCSRCEELPWYQVWDDDRKQWPDWHEAEDFHPEDVWAVRMRGRGGVCVRAGVGCACGGGGGVGWCACGRVGVEVQVVFVYVHVWGGVVGAHACVWAVKVHMCVRVWSGVGWCACACVHVCDVLCVGCVCVLRVLVFVQWAHKFRLNAKAASTSSEFVFKNTKADAAEKLRPGSFGTEDGSTSDKGWVEHQHRPAHHQFLNSQPYHTAGILVAPFDFGVAMVTAGQRGQRLRGVPGPIGDVGPE